MKNLDLDKALAQLSEDKARNSTSFEEELRILLKRHHCNNVIFEEKTGLNATAYRRLTGKEPLSEWERFRGRTHRLSTIISICVGVQLSIWESERLIELAGYRLRFNLERDCLYYLFILNSSFLTIEDCNEELKERGYGFEDLLGSISNGEKVLSKYSKEIPTKKKEATY